MNTSEFLIKARSHGGELTIQVRFDQDVRQYTLTDQIVEIAGNFPDNSGLDHVMEISLLDKLPEHTKIDLGNNILADRVVEITEVSLDGVVLGDAFCAAAKYHHNFNGSGPDIIDNFYGTLGCNGTVRFEFASPCYLWLLANM